MDHSSAIATLQERAKGHHLAPRPEKPAPKPAPVECEPRPFLTEYHTDLLLADAYFRRAAAARLSIRTDMAPAERARLLAEADELTDRGDDIHRRLEQWYEEEQCQCSATNTRTIGS